LHLRNQLKLMLDNQVDLDRPRVEDGSRLLDRLIDEHQRPHKDKIIFIDCLLHNGAKLGSSTWFAARGKHEIQLKLLRKLCQDGYFLYKVSDFHPKGFSKQRTLNLDSTRLLTQVAQTTTTQKSSIEAAVFRFEYALKRIDELEQQIQARCHQSCMAKGHARLLDPSQQEAIIKETQQVKYQTFLGLSRCERKRGVSTNTIDVIL
jgi:hypothetical protein